MTELDAWTCIAVRRDWDDVLARAGLRPRRRQRRLLVAAVAAGLALVAAPAFALVDGVRDFFVGSRLPGFALTAELGPAGTLELRASRIFVARPGGRVFELPPIRTPPPGGRRVA